MSVTLFAELDTHLESPQILDVEDVLKPFRKRFHHPKDKSGNPFIYLCGNSLGLQPDTAEQYVLDELEAWRQLGVDGHLQAKRPWLPYHEFLTSYSAEMVGALDAEVVVMNALTVNIHLLMASFYHPKGKRKKILIENQAFPSDRYAVQSQLKFHGYHPDDDLLILQPDNGEHISMSDVITCLDQHGEEIALVFLGGVHYYTGQALDIKSITAKAQEYGCRVGFDLAHAVGNLKMNLHEWGVDFAAWCGYKYLNGGPGAPSGVFIHERYLGRMDFPRFEGWWGHEKSSRFQMPKEFKPLNTAEAWQISNPPILSMASLLASLEIFHEAGMNQLQQKSEKLTSYLELLLKSELKDHITIITPDSIVSRGCQLSIKLNNPNINIIDILHEKGIVCDWRDPDVLRVAPVPLYNTFDDCYQFVHILKGILNES